MKQKIIVTNLRIPENLWLGVKASAASAGISVNEYLKELIDISEKKKFFAYTEKTVPVKKKGKRLYESLWRLLEKPYDRKPLEASEDDKIIYGIEDE